MIAAVARRGPAQSARPVFHLLGFAAAVGPDVALPVRDHSKSKSTLFAPGVANVLQA